MGAPVSAAHGEPPLKRSRHGPAALELLLELICELPEPVTPPDIAADPADHPDFVGTYYEPQYFGDMIITEDATALRIEIPAVSPSEYDPVLTPVSRGNYVLHMTSDYALTFIRGAGEQAEYLRHRNFVGVRVSDGNPPSPPPRSKNPQLDLGRHRIPEEPTPFSLALPRSLR